MRRPLSLPFLKKRRVEGDFGAGGDAGAYAARRQKAEAMVERYAPMFRALDARGIPYCLVGGTAVLVWTYLANDPALRMRATEDADLMVPGSMSESDFTDVYREAYGVASPRMPEVGDDGLNFSIWGVAGAPRFDVAKTLNGFDLNTLEKAKVDFRGEAIIVATPQQLAEMKRRTIELLRAAPEDSSRLKDFIDLRTLSEIVRSAAK